MNGLKNLIIIAVLAAVGYGVYVSLSRNNVDTGQPSGVADEWPTAPKVELPSRQASPGGPLPLTADSTTSTGTTGLGGGGTAPPFTPPLAAGPSGNPPNTTLGTPPAMNPYPSSAPAPAASPTPPPAPPLISTSGSASAPSGTSAGLGPPLPPDSAAAPPSNPPPPSAQQPSPQGSVRNLTPPPATPVPDAVAPSKPAAGDSLIQSQFNAFMEAVQKKLEAGKLAEVILELSKIYDDPNLPPEMAKQITALLDQLAGTVIYSRQHYLERPYVTQSGETIDSIAEKYHVPWQLLAKINGLMPPDASNADATVADRPLPAGRELKVVRGPFNAVIHLDRHELTLMAGDYYAGRFPIGIGKGQPKLEGEYTVLNKTLTDDGSNGVSPNPLGSAWIGLTDRIGIHGTNNPQGIGRDDNPGAICAGDRHLQQLYGILSVGSRVVILR